MPTMKHSRTATVAHKSATVTSDAQQRVSRFWHAQHGWRFVRASDADGATTLHFECSL